jgi:hypothetical protein
MRAAAIAMILSSAVFLVPARPSAAPPNDIKAYCATKWTEYSMQAHCVRQEEAAQAKLSRGVDDQGIWTRCWHKWDSWSMVEHCVRQEQGAKANLGGRSAPPPPTSPPAPPTPSAAPIPSPAPAYDRQAVETCSQFLTGAKRIADGVAGSSYGIELEMRSVYSRAEQSSDRILQQKAGALVREAQALPSARSTTSMMAAVNDFAGYCRNTVLAGPSTVIFGPTSPPSTIDPPQPPAKPITPQEAETMTKRATEQGGKKCETKVYGGGAAVTVCE